ncbi:YtxH domain-containing protein [Clostridium akagii]|uniref:YtxH domain-containing protein n=1 Tax=Clostridium akagii TaxID=91623 RepID=UPI00068E27DA|nr:YtxH domain-containing protein [Clostridium akagii]
MKIREMLEKKMLERQKKHRAKMVKKITVGAFAGIVTGVVGGVLLAPKAGKETRDDIAKTAKELGENAISKTTDIKENLDNKVVETKNNVVSAKEKIAKYLSDKKAEKNNSEAKSVIDEKNEVEVIGKTKTEE